MWLADWLSLCYTFTSLPVALLISLTFIPPVTNIAKLRNHSSEFLIETLFGWIEIEGFILPKAVKSTFYLNVLFVTLCHMDLTGFGNKPLNCRTENKILRADAHYFWRYQWDIHHIKPVCVTHWASAPAPLVMTQGLQCAAVHAVFRGIFKIQVGGGVCACPPPLWRWKIVPILMRKIR